MCQISVKAAVWIKRPSAIRFDSSARATQQQFFYQPIEPVQSRTGAAAETGLSRERGGGARGYTQFWQKLNFNFGPIISTKKLLIPEKSM